MCGRGEQVHVCESVLEEDICWRWGWEGCAGARVVGGRLGVVGRGDKCTCVEEWVGRCAGRSMSNSRLRGLQMSDGGVQGG